MQLQKKLRFLEVFILLLVSPFRFESHLDFEEHGYRNPEVSEKLCVFINSVACLSSACCCSGMRLDVRDMSVNKP